MIRLSVIYCTICCLPTVLHRKHALGKSKGRFNLLFFSSFQPCHRRSRCDTFCTVLRCAFWHVETHQPNTSKNIKISPGDLTNMATEIFHVQPFATAQIHTWTFPMCVTFVPFYQEQTHQKADILHIFKIQVYPWMFTFFSDQRWV